MVTLRPNLSVFEPARAQQRATALEGPTKPMPAPRLSFTQDSFVSATPSAVKRAALQRGMTGGLVRELQRHLVAEGDLRSSDVATGPGVFGPRTEAAVKAFQKREKLPVTGMVGPQTWAALLGDGGSATVTEVPRTLDLSVTRPPNPSTLAARRR